VKEATYREYEKAINKVVEYINTHLYNVPTTRELAGIANISAFHLHRIFKSIIGENIGEFINRLRLEDVALRLLTKKSTLEDIALSTGYGTKHALSRAFKNHFGVSPSIYRTQSKNLYPFFLSQQETILNLVPVIKKISPKTIVYIRIINVYGAEESFREGWRKLGQFAKEKGVINSDVEFIGLSFDDPTITKPARCRFYACFTPSKPVDPEGPFGVRDIPGGYYAVFLHKGAYCKLKDTYYYIYIYWASQTEYNIKGSLSFEKYLNSPSSVDEENLLTEIYIPITKKGGCY